MPWVLGGDFNIIADPLEYSGEMIARAGGMHDFNEFIISAGVCDAGYVGSKFTWTNGNVWKRLDRVLVTSNWSQFFNSFKVEHLNRYGSDHSPLLINGFFMPKPKGSFRFQNMWVQHHDFVQTVRLQWNNPCQEIGLDRFAIKLKRLKAHLKWWNRDVFGNIFDNLKRLNEEVNQKEIEFDYEATAARRTALNLAQANLAKALHMEEAYWKQKASIRWTVEGERNTKLFHNVVNKKRNTNRIHRIWDQGLCLDRPLAIQESGASFFEQLLTGEDTILAQFNPDIIPKILHEGDNSIIAAPPTVEELKEVVFSMHPDSAAGPDG
ncbi:hypothetical protein F511_44900 [Dorcoceras hygrometricum]|uniref:Endonuclease/exonuclease/phosphatase domain-containing protein n=1 Tax=Dorcoceras hygrometricum TaxID=472368 RepID=A0A2Z7D1R3_9LAMI|nr:hypothetical protein F511_44900 [Dorcoceras hygrometricum]